MMPERRDATNSASGSLARSLVRKGGPFLMRACRCVSERRSRASTEVIGQYQSQPRDNHSPAMRPADACMSTCVRACSCASANASVRHSCKTNYFSRRSHCRRAYPVELRDFQGEGFSEGEGDRRNRVCIRFAEGTDSLRRKRERRRLSPGASRKFKVSIRLNRGFD